MGSRASVLSVCTTTRQHVCETIDFVLSFPGPSLVPLNSRSVTLSVNWELWLQAGDIWRLFKADSSIHHWKEPWQTPRPWVVLILNWSHWKDAHGPGVYWSFTTLREHTSSLPLAARAQGEGSLHSSAAAQKWATLMTKVERNAFAKTFLTLCFPGQWKWLTWLVRWFLDTWGCLLL